MIEVIVNPNSGGGKGYIKWQIAERVLIEKGIEYNAQLTTGPGDAIRMAEEITSGDMSDKILVAVGGDGTFNEVLNGIKDFEKVTLGYIAVGTGNDLARGVGISYKPVEAINAIIENKKVIEMDYGVASFGNTERRFAISCGIGYDAAVCVAIENSVLRKKLAKINKQKSVYTLLGALQILKSKSVSGYVILDGKNKIEYDSIFFTSVQNQVTEGGGKPFTPGALYDDGRFAVCVFNKKGVISIVGTLAAALKGKHVGMKGIDLLDVETIDIHMSEALPFHTDGELHGEHKDISIRCEKRKLKLIV